MDRRNLVRAAALVAFFGTLIWALAGVGFFGVDWAKAARDFVSFGADFFPPDFSNPSELWQEILETIQMAYVGTVLGALVAIPLAALATRPLTGWAISGPMRILLAATRTIPSYIWALILIVVVGLGALPGMLALAAYTVGYLGKLYYEAFEGVDPEILEAVRSTGTSRWSLVRHAVIPEAANPILSQLLFIFEYNVRASSILGFVGAGGIGLTLNRAFDAGNYERVMAALLVLLAVVLLLDYASGHIRRRYLVESPAAHPA